MERMTVEEVHGVLEHARGLKLDRQMVSVVLSGMNQDALIQHTRLRVRWIMWDRVSPLNGVLAEDIMGRPDYTGGVVYLVFIDNALALIQMHAPTVQGLEPMTVATAAEHAEVQVIELREQLFRQSVVAAVDERLVTAGLYAGNSGPLAPVPKTGVIYTEGVSEPDGIAQAALDARNA